ncbi:MAG: MBL fold metallo-hydrolase [Coriobacteriales bacterium]|nr:MBL fold metallo-hydrolase [Coriobacteriales bacterium]
MRLTVLGSSASYAGPGQACSGHLVQAECSSILLDCGNGVIANLASIMDPARLDAIFVTHEHTDHWVDIYALQALLRYGPDGPAAPIGLFLPEGLFERMQAPLNKRGAEELAEAFVVHHLVDGVEVMAGDCVVTPRRVDHVYPTFAIEVQGDGARLVYGADTAPGDAILEVARGADLLIAEATLPDRYADAAPHMTPRQAGELGRAAGASQLVLSHLWPSIDREEAAVQATEAFGAPASVAREFDAFEVTPARAGKGVG